MAKRDTSSGKNGSALITLLLSLGGLALWWQSAGSGRKDRQPVQLTSGFEESDSGASGEDGSGARKAGKPGRFGRLKQALLSVRGIKLTYNAAVEFGKDNGSTIAAGVAYYAVLALFPLILGTIAVLGYVVSPETIRDVIFSFVEENLPASGELVRNNIQTILETRGALGLVSILGLLWSGSAIFGAVSAAINQAWDIRKRRHFIVEKARQLGMAFGTGVLFLASMVITSALTFITGQNLPFSDVIAQVFGRLLAFLIIYAILLFLYKFMPNTRTYWRDVWLGALITAVLFEVARNLFTLYLENFGSYPLVYGSIASVIILFVWIYYSAIILIFGAEFTSEYSRMRRGSVERVSAKLEDRETQDLASRQGPPARLRRMQPSG